MISAPPVDIVFDRGNARVRRIPRSRYADGPTDKKDLLGPVGRHAGLSGVTRLGIA
jgi:hypothetical protein